MLDKSLTLLYCRQLQDETLEERAELGVVPHTLRWKPRPCSFWKKCGGIVAGIGQKI